MGIFSDPSQWAINRGSGPNPTLNKALLFGTGSYSTPYVGEIDGLGYATQFMQVSSGTNSFVSLLDITPNIAGPFAGSAGNAEIAACPFRSIVISTWIASYTTSHEISMIGTPISDANFVAPYWSPSIDKMGVTVGSTASRSNAFAEPVTSVVSGLGAPLPTKPNHLFACIDGSSGRVSLALNGSIIATGAVIPGAVGIRSRTGPPFAPFNPLTPSIGMYGGLIADYWLGYFNQSIDVSTLLSKFITPQGNPIYLGNSGELPMGQKPYAFFSLNTFFTNPPPPTRVLNIGGSPGALGYNPGFGGRSSSPFKTSPLPNVPLPDTLNAPLWTCCDLTGSYGCGQSLNVTGAGTR